jgi:hypothetical protein
MDSERTITGFGAQSTAAEAGERSAADISAGTGNSRVLAAPLDLADPAAAARLWQDSINPLSASSRNSGRDRCR